MSDQDDEVQEVLSLPKRRRGRPRKDGTTFAFDPRAGHQRTRKRDLSTGLNYQQQQFAEYIVQGRTLTEASRMAGYDGHPANASRRAGHPKIRAYIEKLREIRKASAQVAEKAEAKAVEKGFADEATTISWLITEARKNMEEARGQGKFKDSNDSIKLIAQLAGHMKGGIDTGDEPVDKDKNRADPKNQINLQILNQYTKRLDHSVGDEPPALQAVTVEVAEDLGGPLSIPGPGDSADGPDGSGGADPGTVLRDALEGSPE